MKLATSHLPLFSAIRPVLLIALVAMTLSGCMITRPESGPTFQYVEENWVPESETAQLWLLPLLFPVGAVAVLADAVVVHPISILDDAADDTQGALWRDVTWDERYMTESAVFPWRIVLTPIFYSLDVAGRSLFEIPKAAETERQLEQRAELHRELMGTLEKALADKEAGRGEEGIQAILEAQMKGIEELDWLPHDELMAMKLEVLNFARESGNYHLFLRLALSDYSDATRSLDFEELIEVMGVWPDEADRRTAFAYRWNRRGRDLKVATQILKEMLNDPSPDIRHEALWWGWEADRDSPNRFYGGLGTELDRIATEDPSEELRIEALSLIREIERNK